MNPRLNLKSAFIAFAVLFGLSSAVRVNENDLSLGIVIGSGGFSWILLNTHGSGFHSEAQIELVEALIWYGTVAVSVLVMTVVTHQPFDSARPTIFGGVSWISCSELQ
ncbi:hypothetical protein [Thermococcus piezophilus]|uniref:hypothetical protein n=1 Tax=Thermococcus piezophilus TaxID=1712654 RepID=UPI001900478D|nr:hypothetical protein [Thermococcus piezophilus]